MTELAAPHGTASTLPPPSANGSAPPPRPAGTHPQSGNGQSAPKSLPLHRPSR